MWDMKKKNEKIKSLNSILIVVIFTFLYSFDSAVAQGWTAEGRKVKWTMSVPDQWIGGNYYQIEKVSRESENSRIKMLLRTMQRDARKLDVYLIHMDVSGVHTLTSIRVNVGKGYGNNYFNKDTWLAYAQILQLDYPKGSRTRLVSYKSLTTGGLPAYQAKFKTTEPNGGIIFEVMHVVILSSNKSHIFNFKVDSTKYLRRYAEFSQMLRSVKYQ